MSSLKLNKQEQAAWLRPPLDFSFKQLSSENDIAQHKPRKNRIGKLPQIGPDNKYKATAVWLGNNKLQTTRDAAAILNLVLAVPSQLAWLDLSFNQIYDIDEQILEFKCLKILYLHGNQIHNMSAVSLLRGLPELRTLTLHGNPIDCIPQYRGLVLNMLPQLTSMDFSPVVQSERKAVSPRMYVEPKLTEKKPIPENSK